MIPPYGILFEPVQIGPVTAPNRFYQVPHCNGMGHRYPRGHAAMRAVKAEGGWGVVCTEEVEIHPTSDVTPYIEGRLWDDSDIPALAMMCDAVHEHGALAGIELVHNGISCANLTTRLPPLGPRSMAVEGYHPVQTRAMDKADIRTFRRWHRDAALRARRAGFDIVYVYAGHWLALPMHFLARRTNDRSDEYGGSLENRLRLFRELIEDTKEAVGDRCAVAVRFAVDELLGDGGITSDGEGREAVEALAELPDLWDVNVSAWANDSVTSRFAAQGYQQAHTAFVKSVTSKPVVGVGRFTSPDEMVALIRRGEMDLIGAARPSIADPFLPNKIREGRADEIRECIGCNICVAGDMTISPIRCTQNPTMGEEWRRNWHPERIEPASRAGESVLIVGAGPAGLEAALSASKRGYRVVLAEREKSLGGRIRREAALPGLAEWMRVHDHRTLLLGRAVNVDIYPGSPMSAADVRAVGADHVLIATGARWRCDGVGRATRGGVPLDEDAPVLSPDDVMTGRRPVGRVVIYDDDHYYMGGAMAELAARAGCAVTYVTPAADVSHWTHNTLEQHRIQARLLSLGVRVIAHHSLAALRKGQVMLACVFTGQQKTLEADTVIPLTERIPDDGLLRELQAGGMENVRGIGDCVAPGTIAAAVYAGHLAAREIGFPTGGDGVPYRREVS